MMRQIYRWTGRRELVVNGENDREKNEEMSNESKEMEKMGEAEKLVKEWKWWVRKIVGMRERDQRENGQSRICRKGVKMMGEEKNLVMSWWDGRENCRNLNSDVRDGEKIVVMSKNVGVKKS